MSCAKADARPREDPATGGGGVTPIAPRFRQRPSRLNARDDSGIEAKEAGSMVARRRQEDGRRKQKTRKKTDKNGAVKQGQTAEEDKNKKILIMWPQQVLYLNQWSNRN